MRADRGVPDEGNAVSVRPERTRMVLGVQVTAQAVAFLVAALCLTVFVGLAVLAWLERSA